jgi:putative DNA primase/helicase
MSFDANEALRKAGLKEPPKGELDSANASTFTMHAINWLWPNRFALGKLGLIAGLPDRGKGLITADMTARITNGDLWPCGEGRALQGRVLILSAEDDIEDTIIPRLVAAGAALDRVEILRMVRQGDGKRMFSLITDLELLQRKVQELGDVVMVIIDPMSAYLGIGKVDSYRTTDVRGVLAPLTEFAASKQIFVLGVLHFNKKTDVNNAMLRISDSLAFAATARHCYVVVDDPENERKLFVKAKNNLAPDTKALSYAINAVVGQDAKTGKDIWAPRVAWGLEHVEITATQAMEAEASGKSSANPRNAAKTFLAELLANGPVAKHEIEEAAAANCISLTTLKRAKTELDVIAKKLGMKDGWTWRLPEQPANHWHRRDD